MTASCSERNVELVRSIGADRVIDYTKEDPVKVFTQNEFDIVFDCVGGAEVYVAHVLQCHFNQLDLPFQGGNESGVYVY